MADERALAARAVQFLGFIKTLTLFKCSF